MVALTKDLKIRLLKAMQKGSFSGEDFPELAKEFMAKPMSKAQAREIIEKLESDEGWNLGRR